MWKSIKSHSIPRRSTLLGNQLPFSSVARLNKCLWQYHTVWGVTFTTLILFQHVQSCKLQLLNVSVPSKPHPLKHFLVYGVYRHFQQYVSYIAEVSFIGGGNRRNHRLAAGHCQILSHNVVSSTARLSKVRTYNFSVLIPLVVVNLNTIRSRPRRCLTLYV